MRGQVLLISILFTLLQVSIAQPYLKPSIGLSRAPSDSDRICHIPFYLGDYDTSGYYLGDTVHDFKLYNSQGGHMNLVDELRKGKPVLLISGSYTCPVFRANISTINQITTKYAGLINTYVIYTLEAHPKTDTCVYVGFPHVTSSNLIEGVLYRQPKIYSQRKSIVNAMLSSFTLDAPVYLDGPCNSWWEHFGPAPNNSYLINTNGVVISKHGWFDQAPNDIFCDLDTLLGLASNCGPSNPIGVFMYSSLSPDTLVDQEESIIEFKAELNNPSLGDAQIEIIRQINDIPNDWKSALCVDVCLPPTVDTTYVTIPSGKNQAFTFYFFTDGKADTGRAKVIFRNVNQPTNSFTRTFIAVTEKTVIPTVEEIRKKSVHIYPNPSNGLVNLVFDENIGYVEIDILDSKGSVIDRLGNNGLKMLSINISGPSGFYFLKIRTKEGLFTTYRVLKK